MAMPPKQVKAECVCGESKQTEHTHNLENRDARNKKPVDNLGCYNEGCKENQPTLEQRDSGLDDDAPGNGVQAKTIRQGVAKVIKAIGQQCR